MKLDNVTWDLNNGLFEKCEIFNAPMKRSLNIEDFLFLIGNKAENIITFSDFRFH